MKSPFEVFAFHKESFNFAFSILSCVIIIIMLETSVFANLFDAS